MLKIALSGCNGRMGRVISDIVANKKDMEIVAGFDINTEKHAGFPVYADPFEFPGACDVIIDFSNASSTEHSAGLLRAAQYAHCHLHDRTLTGTASEHSNRLRKVPDLPFGQYVHRHQSDDGAAPQIRIRARRKL